MLHAMSLAIVIAYDIYLEVTEGQLDEDWKLTYPVDFWTFRDVLSIQMLEYDPKNRRYLGDDSMLACTKQNKNKRRYDDADKSSSSKRSRCSPSAVAKKQAMEASEFKKAKFGRGENSRLCGNLSRLDKHIKSVETALKHPRHAKYAVGMHTLFVESVVFLSTSSQPKVSMLEKCVFLIIMMTHFLD